MVRIVLTPEEMKEDLALALEVCESNLRHWPAAMATVARLRTLARIALAWKQSCLSLYDKHADYDKRCVAYLDDIRGQLLKATRERDDALCSLDQARQRLTRQAESITQLQERLQRATKDLDTVTAERNKLSQTIEEWEFAPTTPLIDALSDLAEFAEEIADNDTPETAGDPQTPLESLRWIAYHAALCYATARTNEQQSGGNVHREQEAAEPHFCQSNPCACDVD